MAQIGSIRDVAQETGLSTATISRVFNGSEKVSEATRERVLEACRQLDYVPNAAARALATRRTRTVAAIIPTIEHSVFAKYIAAIEETLAQRNYSLVLAISNADKGEELKAARKLLGMGADAFILTGADHDPELFDLLDRRNIPFVFTSVWEHGQQHPTIGYNNEGLAQMAVEYLAEHGHRRIAVCHGPLAESDRTVARKRGAESAAASVKLVDTFEAEVSVSGGKAVASRIFESPTAYTAILCFSDVLALGVNFKAQHIGLRVPEDVSIMGFDNLDWSADMTPSLTTINLPARRMGRDVAAQLLRHLEDGEVIESMELKGEIIERESVRNLTG